MCVQQTLEAKETDGFGSEWAAGVTAGEMRLGDAPVSDSSRTEQLLGKN